MMLWCRHQHKYYSPLALASDFFQKGLLGKYIFVFTCPNRQADFLNTIHISFIVNGPNTQKYANNATKLKRKWYLNLQIHDKQYIPITTCLGWQVSPENYVDARGALAVYCIK